MRRIEREGAGNVPRSLVGWTYVLSLDERLKPNARRLRSIIRAGGGRVWEEEALPHQEDCSNVLVVLPKEILAGAEERDGNPLRRSALERGVACVPPEYLIERLTQCAPRGVAAFRA